MFSQEDNTYCAKHKQIPSEVVQLIGVKNVQVPQLALLTNTFPFYPLQVIFLVFVRFLFHVPFCTFLLFDARSFFFRLFNAPLSWSIR